MQLRGGLAGDREDLRGEQREDDAVLVRRPHGAVLTQEGGSRGLFAAETDGAVEQTGNEVLEADGDLDELTAHRRDDAVDEGGGDEGLADRGISLPSRAMLEQVVDRNREVVVRVHETVRRHDPMTIRVGVVAGRNIVGGVAVLVRCHGVAQGSHEQSMRILPSQSSVMKGQAGSTTGFTTVSSRP